MRQWGAILGPRTYGGRAAGRIVDAATRVGWVGPDTYEILARAWDPGGMSFKVLQSESQRSRWDPLRMKQDGARLDPRPVAAYRPHRHHRLLTVILTSLFHRRGVQDVPG